MDDSLEVKGLTGIANADLYGFTLACLLMQSPSLHLPGTNHVNLAS